MNQENTQNKQEGTGKKIVKRIMWVLLFLVVAFVALEMYGISSIHDDNSQPVSSSSSQSVIGSTSNQNNDDDQDND